MANREPDPSVTIHRVRGYAGERWWRDTVAMILQRHWRRCGKLRNPREAPRYTYLWNITDKLIDREVASWYAIELCWLRDQAREEYHRQRNQKISNSSSFGIIDMTDSSTSDRIIVIVKMARFIHDGASRWRFGCQTILVSASH